MTSRALALAAVLLVGCGVQQPNDVHVRRAQIRPTDGDGWNGNGYAAGTTVDRVDAPGGKVRMHYARDGADAVPAADADSDGVPDFVSRFAAIFGEVYDFETTQLGFREPLDDSAYHDRPDFGGDGRFDVYLKDQGGGADGYAVKEACASGTPRRCAGYMVVENDFKGYAYPTPEDGMKILASHEFFHMVQAAYSDALGSAFSEGTAVWATEKLYPEQKDFEGFIKHFFSDSARPIDDKPKSPADLFVYGAAIWPMFLDQRFGKDIVPAIFEELGKGQSSSAADAADAVLARDHQSSLAEAFGEMALWNLLTGDRAVSGKGYKEAASYPQVTVEDVAGSHPLRISGEIAYLSARYYRVKADDKTRITVTVEREQPKLMLHLVTGDKSDPLIVSGKPEEDELSIDARGDVIIIAASTARRDKQLPLSLAVRGSAIDKPPVNPPPPDPDPDPNGGGGGCAVASIAPANTLVFFFAALLLLGFRQRERQRRRVSRGRA
ncbi:MAG: hypothetical protein KC503_44825 [Myxococcales bacterium]|nr:hypothetical protein [Myxococcales bacterium]